MKPLFITGFEPFQGESINPSQILVEHLSREFDLPYAIIPVAYKQAGQKIESLFRDTMFCNLLMIGQAGGRSRVSLERFAHNIDDCSFADEAGELRIDQRINLAAPLAHETSYPIRRWVDSLAEERMLVEVSHSAGAFICNHIYFLALQEIYKKQLQVGALFVHVPYLPNQVLGKDQNTPSLSFEDQLTTLRKLIEFILAQ